MGAVVGFCIFGPSFFSFACIHHVYFWLLIQFFDRQLLTINTICICLLKKKKIYVILGSFSMVVGA